MKTQIQKSSAIKIVSGFDKMLKNLLTEDLRSFKSHEQFLHSNHQPATQVRLSVA